MAQGVLWYHIWTERTFGDGKGDGKGGDGTTVSADPKV